MKNKKYRSIENKISLTSLDNFKSLPDFVIKLMYAMDCFMTMHALSFAMNTCLEYLKAEISDLSLIIMPQRRQVLKMNFVF